MTTTRPTSFTKSGFLLKRGELNKAWRVRWYLQMFFYFSKPLGLFLLKINYITIGQVMKQNQFPSFLWIKLWPEYTQIVIQANMNRSAKRKAKKTFVLKLSRNRFVSCSSSISHCSQRVYQLVAANHQDMVEWLRALASHTILHHENELITQV